MPGEGRRSDRKNTDTSLDAERTKTDDELARRAARAAEDADHVVATARRRADAVLAHARESAETQSDPEDVQGRAARIATRATEDAVVAGERDVADAQLAMERAQRRRDVSHLLADERAVTDTHLSNERRSADASVEARDEVLGVVRHELRNLAMGAALSATVLTTIPIADPRARAAVDAEAARIREATDLMQRVVDDLVDLAAIDASRLRIVTGPDDPKGLLHQTRELFAPAAAVKGVTLRVEDAGVDGFETECDHARILQVLANLVGNAVKFTPRGGEIVLRAEATGAAVLFEVRDDGPGVPAEEVARIFDRSYRATTGAGTAGLGLGLYIARGIVEAHGGRIWVDSRPGAGSSFRFEIPTRPHASV